VDRLRDTRKKSSGVLAGPRNGPPEFEYRDRKVTFSTSGPFLSHFSSPRGHFFDPPGGHFSTLRRSLLDRPSELKSFRVFFYDLQKGGLSPESDFLDLRDHFFVIFIHFFVTRGGFLETLASGRNQAVNSGLSPCPHTTTTEKFNNMMCIRRVIIY